MGSLVRSTFSSMNIKGENMNIVFIVLFGLLVLAFLFMAFSTLLLLVIKMWCAMIGDYSVARDWMKYEKKGSLQERYQSWILEIPKEEA